MISEIGVEVDFGEGSRAKGSGEHRAPLLPKQSQRKIL